MTQEEYVKRFAENQKITGFGVEGMRIHVPCPFCAAPDIMVHKLLDTFEVYKNGATCKECGRGFKAVYTKFEESDTGFEHAQSARFEIVQTCGDDPPDFLPPMRRVFEA